jgi:hypothetical protein
MQERWLATIAGPDSSGASDADLDAAAASLGIQLPEDYRAVMRRTNGGDHEFGESWLLLYRAEDLAANNAGYAVKEFAPGFSYFGSNGAGEAYAWDWRPDRKSRYVVIPLIEPSPRNGGSMRQYF